METLKNNSHAGKLTMVYTDISILALQPNTYINLIMARLHTYCGDICFGVYFPFYKEGDKSINRPDRVNTYDSYAQTGNVLRIIANNTADLASLLSLIDLVELEKRSILISKPILSVPNSSEGICIKRWRPAYLKSNTKINVESARILFQTQLHEVFYILHHSISTGQKFSLFFKQIKTDEVCFKLNSADFNSFGAAKSKLGLPYF